jgi:phenylacetaldehyde dehydrogenase
MATSATEAAILGSVLDLLTVPRKMLIDGNWVEAASGKTFAVFNPATGDEIARVAEGDKEDIDLAVAAARRAFETGPWPAMKPCDRGKLLWRLGELVEEHAGELAQLETLDNG